MSKFSFGNIPVLRYSRSRQNLSHTVKTSMTLGTLYPIDVQEVYAGDTFKVKHKVVTRLSSQFLRPIMDNVFLDEYTFFVPSRLLFDKFPNVFGENTESAWANSKEYTIPALSDTAQIYSQSVGDYLGLPVTENEDGTAAGALGHPVSVLPFRAFAKIYDDWFRDENNVSPMHIQTGDISPSESPNNNAWGPSNYTGKLPRVGKLSDYFTRALPSPQKGVAPEISVASTNDVPVYTGAVHPGHPGGDRPLLFDSTGVPFSADTNRPVAFLGTTVGSHHYGYLGRGTTPLETKYNEGAIYPANLWANTENMVFNPISINDLRFAFQYQRMLERDALGGTRYTEYLASHFGVTSPDSRLQRSEFLGGRRSPISIQQVTQTTGEGSSTSPLGSVGAFSLSNSQSRYTKGFVEHGYVVTVACIRQIHSYQQGIERFWSRTKRTDFYDPVFSHIGMQPIYKKELAYFADKDAVFGYTEAWDDLRHRPNKITGQMRSHVPDSLDIWHIADDYSSAPTLNANFIQETPMYLDRAITVSSSVYDQFIVDFYIQNTAYRVMPVFGTPGLIDHN